MSQKKVLRELRTDQATEYPQWDPYWACVGLAAILLGAGYGIYSLVIFFTST